MTPTSIAIFAATAEAPALTWTLIRTTGLIAVALLTLSVAVGLIAPTLRNPTARLTAISAHSMAGGVGLLLLVGHIVFSLADSYIDITPVDVVVPGFANWETTWLALGTVATDLLLIVIVTTALRFRLVANWRPCPWPLPTLQGRPPADNRHQCLLPMP